MPPRWRQRTDANFTANYQTDSAHVTKAQAALQLLRRLWMGNGVLYAGQMSDFDTLLTGLSIPHTYASSNNGNGSHVFDSSWVLPGADVVGEMGARTPRKRRLPR